MKKKLNPIPEDILPGTRVVIGKPDFDNTYVFICESGFGMSGRARGTAIFGKFEVDGEEARIERYMIKGLAK